MAYPAGITLRTVKVGGATALESGEPLTITVRIAASRSMIWGATGWRFPSVVYEVAGTVGNEISVDLPITNQAGWRTNSNQVIDVSAAGSYTHTYTATVTTTANGRVVSQDVIGPFALPTGDGTPVDLDLTLPTTTVAGGVVQVPDTWDAKVAAAEAAATRVDQKLTTTDVAVAGFMADPASATRGELDKRVTLLFGTSGAPAENPNIILGGKANGSGFAPDVYGSVILNPGQAAGGFNNIVGGDGSATVGIPAAALNTPTTGTNASISVIGGYDNVAGSLSSKIISDHSYTEVGGEGHNAIYGGANNICRSTAGFAGIFAGYETEVGGLYAFATGRRNKASGQSTVVFGNDNTVTGTGSTASGSFNVVSGAYSAVAGNRNEVAGGYGAAWGQQAKTLDAYQQAFAPGAFVNPGDAQTSVYVIKRKTTASASAPLGVGGGSIGPIIAANGSVVMTAMIVARHETGTDTAAWEVKAVLRRGATGAPVVVGTPAITRLAADAGADAWSVLSVTGGSTGGLNVNVAGDASRPVRWVMRMTTVDVGA